MQQDVILSLEKASIFQGGNMILSDLNVEIKRGDFFYLTGKTGSGKSSFIKTVYCDLPLVEGKGRVIDYDLRNIKPKEIPFLRRKLGIIFQDFQLLTDRTVDENMSFVLRATGWKNSKMIKSRIEETLWKVGMETKGFKMPFELSGGEQQRVSIARALLNEPEFILADEPTGNLDSETSEGIFFLLKEINMEGKTVLVSTHDFLLIEKFPSSILECVGGKIKLIN
ncbi:cell division ATP-binding protein FtsE [Ichthyobacterium seriolicida]|uniref:Phosphonate ABC transporter ATP-binding protein n=1 Tax=Ichthyobacterium seriolicida TaxID=242600 RepID=A0A1J1E0Q7_9FLAO|nr:ATP-binding cassette domain-containing protein [Ichthyobacterium seriolicida]BAV94517.1 phosphonate ABC transporter ATP-binding protein [Ichthyobacterium seriolicida]